MPNNSYDKIISDALDTASGNYPKPTEYTREEALRMREDERHNSWWYRLWHPGEVQEKEFGQQIALQQYQNEWNSEDARMQRMKEAGINPLTAAGAIAGQGTSPSTGSVPSAIGAEANTLKTIADIGSGIAGVGSGIGSLASSYIGFMKLIPEINNITQDTANKLADMGFTNAQTYGVLKDNFYKGQDWEATLNIKRQQYTNMCSELNNIRARHDEIMKSIDQIQSQIDLNTSLQDYYDSVKMKIDEDLRYAKELNDFRIGNKLFINDSGLDGIIWSMAMNGSSQDDIDKFVDIYSNYRSKIADVEYEARYGTEAKYVGVIAGAKEFAASMNQIITDWSTPASNMWQLIDKAFNVSSTGDSKAVKDAKAALLAGRDKFQAYSEIQMSLQITLDNLNSEISHAAAQNELSRVRELTKQKAGLESFIKSFNFVEFEKHYK